MGIPAKPGRSLVARSVWPSMPWAGRETKIAIARGTSSLVVSASASFAIDASKRDTAEASASWARRTKTTRQDVLSNRLTDAKNAIPATGASVPNIAPGTPTGKWPAGASTKIYVRASKVEPVPWVLQP